MASTPINLVANGNISPARFVKMDTGAGNDTYGLQAAAGDPTVGIASESTNQPPLSDLITTQYHAQLGEPIRLYGMGDICLLEIGAAVTQGQRLKSDVNGRGIAVTTDGDYFGAIALEAGTALSQKVKVQVTSPSAQSAL